jgi:hypothetical protein
MNRRQKLLKARQLRAKTVALTADRDQREKSALRDIYRMLVQPILDQRPDDYDLNDWLAAIWGNREIYTVKAKCTFECPGCFMAAPKLPVYGYRNNKIPKDTRVWIRRDNDYTERYGIDIETIDGRWFKLTTKQFQEISHYFIREQ